MSRKNSYSDNFSGNESAKMMSSTTAFELLIKRREAMKKKSIHCIYKDSSDTAGRGIISPLYCLMSFFIGLDRPIKYLRGLIAKKLG